MNKTEKIIRKEYYRIKFTLKSPLSISSGDNKKTDRDLILNSQNKPYIPGSAIAGMMRHALAELYACAPNKIENTLGNVKKVTETNNVAGQLESRVIFYDAVIENDSVVYTSVRDSVALDDFKTANKGAKFDMEVLEAGARFCTYIEHTIYGEDPDLGSLIPLIFKDGRIAFGGKSMRGYGSIGDVLIGKKTFNLTKAVELDKWLDFDLFNETQWEAFEENTIKAQDKCIRLELKQRGGISIRRYTTSVSRNNTDTQPDFEQLTAHEYDKKESRSINGQTGYVPVIPGTSWAGVFRHRMKEFGVDVCSADSMFGFVSEGPNAVKKRSMIRFSESRIKKAKGKILSRNAIDRFSGGTKDGALFTEKTYYNGETELVISWHGKRGMNENEKQALAASIADLHYGFLAVGGETSIGRGLFEIVKINGDSVTGKDVYQFALQQLEEIGK